MDAFDNAVTKAKELFDIAKNKTDEVVSVQKLKFDLSSKNTALNKEYALLGKLYYESIASEEELPEAILAAKNNVKTLLLEIEKLKEEISSKKGEVICPKCNAPVPKDAAFCSRCGNSVE